MSGMQHTEGDPTALLSRMPHVCAQNVTIRSDFTIPHRYIGLSCFILLYFHPLKPMYDMILFRIRVQYDLATFLGTIWATDLFLYDINLGATHTTILSIRGVMILIYLVSRAVTIGLHITTQIHQTALFSFFFLPHTEAHVWYDLMVPSLYDKILWLFLIRYDLLTFPCTISISEPRLRRYSVLGELRSLST